MPKSDLNIEVARELAHLLERVRREGVTMNFEPGDLTIFDSGDVKVHKHANPETHVDIDYKGAGYRLEIEGPFPIDD